MSLHPITRHITLDQLDPWGTVADLGSEILAGEGKAYGKMTAGAPTDLVSAAYFGVSKSTFRMTYPFNEQATVVTGEVLLTDESTGETNRFGVGDSWYVAKGTPVRWEILSDSFVKHYHAVA